MFPHINVQSRHAASARVKKSKDPLVSDDDEGKRSTTSSRMIHSTMNDRRTDNNNNNNNNNSYSKNSNNNNNGLNNVNNIAMDDDVADDDTLNRRSSWNARTSNHNSNTNQKRTNFIQHNSSNDEKHAMTPQPPAVKNRTIEMSSSPTGLLPRIDDKKQSKSLLQLQQKPSMSSLTDIPASPNSRLGAGYNNQNPNDAKSNVPTLLVRTKSDGEMGGSTTNNNNNNNNNNNSPPIIVAPKARTSKLELEVQRLEAAGTLLVQRPGEEIAGLILLEKAIFSRTRFPVLASEIWRRAEQLVVLCCQLVFKLMQQCDESALSRSKEILRIAERILNPPPLATHSTTPPADPFDGFDVLKRSLLASVRVAHAVVLSGMNEYPETILSVVETALQTEQPRPSAATLYNLAVAYVNAGKFDDAAACVLRCIDLVSHYTSMHLNLTRETEPPYRCFLQENATYSILCHHLVASIGSWCNLPQLTLQHAVLALRCAERCLGTQHALTGRCAQFVRSLEMTRMSLGNNSSLAMMNASIRATQDLLAQSLRNRKDSHGAPPMIPFQMSSFSSEFLPSLLIPFTLVQQHPISFDLPAEAYRRPLPPLLISREPVKGIDATTARKMTSEALKSAAASTLTRVPQPPGAAQRKFIQDQQDKKKKKLLLLQQQQQQQKNYQQQPGDGPDNNNNNENNVNQQEQDDDGTLRYLSVIPLRDYELYQKIQQEVAGLVSQTEKFVSGEINRRRNDNVSLLRLPIVPSDAVTSKYDSSVKKLREMSYLKPDHTLDDELLWNNATFRLQKFMRRFVANLHVSRRQAKVRELIRRHVASDKISEAWKLHKLCRAAKRKLHFLRQKRSELDCLVMVQSYLRFHQSIESYAGWYVKYLQRKLWEKQHAKQMQLGAGLIQAVWRSHVVRKRLQFIITNAVKIQRFYRKFRLFTEMRLVVFRRRQRRRNFHALLHNTAAKLQHWFRMEMPRVHAWRELRRRQKLRDTAFQEMYDAEWIKYIFFRDADEGKCGRSIMNFLRRCIWRRNEAERQRRCFLRHAAATMVRRTFLRYKCRKLRLRVCKENEEKLKILQRKEEVREAARDLQRYGRGLLGRVSVFGNLRKLAQQEVAAQRIQRFALLLHAKVQKRLLGERQAFEAARYQTAALRWTSALAVQCAWRRFVAKKFVKGYSTFMGEGRNGIIKKIQRCFRRYRAHVRFSALADKRRQLQQDQQQSQIRECAAKRIQKAFRANLHHRLGRKFAVATICQLAKLRHCVEIIQRRWRYTHARLQRFHLLQARDAQINQWRSDEHRVVSAIVLQRWARSKILIKRQILEAKPELQKRMVMRMQRMARRYIARKKVCDLLTCRDQLWKEENDAKNQKNAAIIIQRNERMRQAKNQYQIRKDAAKVIRDSWHAVFLKRQLKSARVMADYEAYLQSEKEEENKNDEE